MELLSSVAIFVIVTIIIFVWFIIVIAIGKYTVSKDASNAQIILFLAASGPIGWIIIATIFFYDMIDKLCDKHESILKIVDSVRTHKNN